MKRAAVAEALGGLARESVAVSKDGGLEHARGIGRKRRVGQTHQTRAPFVEPSEWEKDALVVEALYEERAFDRAARVQIVEFKELAARSDAGVSILLCERERSHHAHARAAPKL